MEDSEQNQRNLQSGNFIKIKNPLIDNYKNEDFFQLLNGGI